MNAALYIEHDAYAAQWLRNLIAADLIAPGEVYDRDIRDIRPDELAGFTQVHAFAGIGVWSYALRCAGWSDDRPAWTASCPCQPFSAAGRGDGVADERHLWPHFFHLLQYAKPRDVPLLGEQVATTDGLGWLDLVCDDLEAQAHACWPFDLCAAGFGAPHIRQRLYFAAAALECLGGDAADGMVDSIGEGLERQRRHVGGGDQSGRIRTDAVGSVAPTGGTGELAVSTSVGRIGRRTGETRRKPGTVERSARLRTTSSLDDTDRARCDGPIEDAEGDTWDEARVRVSGAGCGSRDMADTGSKRVWREGSDPAARPQAGDQGKGDERERVRADTRSSGTIVSHGNSLPGPVNGFWRDADWLFCRDGKWRPVEPGTFPLVDGSAFRVGSGSTFEGKSRANMLRGYGNAINAEQAQAFIESVMEVLPS